MHAPGRSTWFLGRGEAETCHHATPADASLRPDRTSNRPLSVCQFAFDHEPPGPPPVWQSPRHQSAVRAT
jgi:hypothetical protein